jgi:hypothetical protein
VQYNSKNNLFEFFATVRGKNPSSPEKYAPSSIDIRIKNAQNETPEDIKSIDGHTAHLKK